MTIAAIVLAGGQSRRMGQDKALLIWQGKPLLQRTCEIARQCVPEVAIVTSRVEAYVHLPLPAGCRFVREECPQTPLHGLQRGLAATTGDWVLVLACDLPYLDGRILQTWQRQSASLPATAIAYLPRTKQDEESFWEPLCGFYRRSCTSSLDRFLANGGTSFQKWLSDRDVIEIPRTADSARMLFNCNTPADFAAL